MGEVIHVEFGTEREWEATRLKLVDGLVAIGELFGDEEALMRAKAQCIFQVLRTMVEEMPDTRVTARLPDGVSPEQVAVMTVAIKEAALKGIETALSHVVQVMMASIYDIATSKLARRQ